MQRQILIDAILSGNRNNIEKALPKTTNISHTEITKAFLWLSEKRLYQWESFTNPDDLPQVLQAFDNFFSGVATGNFDDYHVMDKRIRDLEMQTYIFLSEYYSTYIEPGRFEELSPSGEAWRKRGKFCYKPYYTENDLQHG